MMTKTWQPSYVPRSQVHSPSIYFSKTKQAYFAHEMSWCTPKLNFMISVAHISIKHVMVNYIKHGKWHMDYWPQLVCMWQQCGDSLIFVVKTGGAMWYIIFFHVNDYYRAHMYNKSIYANLCYVTPVCLFSLYVSMKIVLIYLCIITLIPGFSLIWIISFDKTIFYNYVCIENN